MARNLNLRFGVCRHSPAQIDEDDTNADRFFNVQINQTFPGDDASLRHAILARTGIARFQNQNFSYHRSGRACAAIRPLANLRNDNATKKRVDEGDEWICLHIDKKPDGVKARTLSGNDVRRAADRQAHEVMLNIHFHEGTWGDDFNVTVTSKDAWFQPQHSTRSGGELVCNLPGAFARMLQREVAHLGNQPRVREGGDRRIEILSFIELPEYRNSYVSLDDGFLRTANLADLTENMKEVINAACVFRVVEREAHWTGNLVAPAREEWEYKFYRLGFLRNNRKDGIVSDSTVAGNGDPIKADWPLIAWRFDDPDWEDQMDFFTTPAYSFGEEYCIGDVKSDTYYTVKEFSRTDQYWGPFERIMRGLRTNAISYDSLLQRIDLYARDDEPDQEKVHAGVPFLPWFCFQSIESAREAHPLRASEKVLRRDTPIHLAIRCVNHIEVNPDIVFPRDMRTDVTRDMNAGDLKQWIRDQFDRQRTGESSRNKRIRLQGSVYLSRRQNEVDIELWVMPQIDVEEPSLDKRLYLFSSRGDQDANNIRDFMSDDFVKRGDTRLYVEAHVVPRVGRYVVAGTVCEEDLS